jgi:hypothetical protein
MNLRERAIWALWRVTCDFRIAARTRARAAYYLNWLKSQRPANWTGF